MDSDVFVAGTPSMPGAVAPHGPRGAPALPLSLVAGEAAAQTMATAPGLAGFVPVTVHVLAAQAVGDWVATLAAFDPTERRDLFVAWQQREARGL